MSIALNRGLWRTSGTNGQRFPVDLSQSKSPSLRFTVTTEREEETFIAWTDAQDCCKNKSFEKSKPGTTKFLSLLSLDELYAEEEDEDSVTADYRHRRHLRTRILGRRRIRSFMSWVRGLET